MGIGPFGYFAHSAVPVIFPASPFPPIWLVSNTPKCISEPILRMTNHLGILEVSRRIRQGTDTLEELSAHLPCHLHINATDDFRLLEFGDSLAGLLGVSREEVATQGAYLLQRRVHPDDLQQAIQLNQAYLAKAHEQSHVSFFQRIRNPRTAQTHEFLFTRGRLLVPQRILNLSLPLQNASLFHHKLIELYEGASFIQAHLHQFNRLTSREIVVCRHLCQGNSLQEVADQLGVSKHTAKNHRTSIYRKLEVRNFFEFYLFASKFKLHLP